MPQTLITKTVPTGPKKRFTQNIPIDQNRAIKKSKTDKLF